VLALVLEDEAIISLALEDALTDAGFQVAGPFSHCARAIAWMEDHTPDVGLLDVELADGPCTEVARALHRRGVPLVFFSGQGPHHLEIRTEFQGAPWFEKPADYAEVVETLQGCLRR
jgi:DNA-binding response OmpR family regulator